MVSEEDLENADKWFARWGDWAAFISRLLPIVRTFIAFPAGVTRIKFRRFLVFSFLGSFIWCGLLALGGEGARMKEPSSAFILAPSSFPRHDHQIP